MTSFGMSKPAQFAETRRRAAQFLAQRLGPRTSVTLTRREALFIMKALIARKPQRARGRPVEKARDLEVAAQFALLQSTYRPDYGRGWKMRLYNDLAGRFGVDAKTIERAVKRALPIIESLPEVREDNPAGADEGHGARQQS